jgi:hypothetical protein
MHLASPIIIKPIAKPGWSLRNMMAKTNISIGPTIQFCTNEKVNIFLLVATLPISSYLTFVRGGYIIIINPIAMGHEIVPELMSAKDFATDGSKYPPNTPIIIAAKIHIVKYLSKKESLILLCFSITLLPSILFIFMIPEL